MRKKIILHHHLGMGDHICLNGLVRNMRDSMEHIILLCKSINKANVEYLYRDVDNVTVVALDIVPHPTMIKEEGV